MGIFTNTSLYHLVTHGQWRLQGLAFKQDLVYCKDRVLITGVHRKVSSFWTRCTT